MLTKQQVADKLNVSFEILNAWQEKGILIPKTIDYLEEDIENFMGESVISSWLADILYQEHEDLSKNLNFLDQQIPVSGMPSGEVKILLYNQNKFNKDYDKKDFFNLIKEMTSAYLFKTITLLSPNSLILYHRKKHNKTVMECENIAITHYKEEDYYKIISNFDKSNISNIINNCKKCVASKNSDILNTIYQSILDIQKNTGLVKPEWWVLLNPKQSNKLNIKNAEKLNSTLHRATHQNITYYIDHSIDANTILVGSKDPNLYGYVICPFILMGLCYNFPTFSSYLGCKLTREGTNFYRCINVI